MVNADLIESVETTPHTVLTLVSGTKVSVRDSMEAIQNRVVEYKRRVFGPAG